MSLCLNIIVRYIPVAHMEHDGLTIKSSPSFPLFHLSVYAEHIYLTRKDAKKTCGPRSRPSCEELRAQGGGLCEPARESRSERDEGLAVECMYLLPHTHAQSVGVQRNDAITLFSFLYFFFILVYR